MPLHYAETTPDYCRLLLWKLDEDEDQLRELLPVTNDHAEFDTITHPQKRREWLAGRVLVKKLVEDQACQQYQGMWKDEHGKPFLVGASCPISITHTSEYVAGVLHQSLPVGIDMEKVHPKLIRTARKFLSDPEVQQAGDHLIRLCMYWCAKEALYKLNGRKKVSFRDSIAIAPFAEDATVLEGTLTDTDRQVRARIYIRWVEDYCLAVAV